MLSLVYAEEFAHGFNARPDPLGRALHAARRAVEVAPIQAPRVQRAGPALFFRKEFAGFRSAAERAIAFNPMDGPTLAGLAQLMAYAGDGSGAALSSSGPCS